MTRFGCTLMTEQNGPRELVDAAVRAEEVGFDLLLSSDHYSPWLTDQSHAPYAWTVLGAVAHATSRVDLMTYVTCPTMRYHPAVVAQKAATLQVLSEGRFTLGPEDVAEQIRCGPDLDAVVEAVRPFWEAGFTDVAFVQVGGGHQQVFLGQAAGPLLEKLRAASG